MMGVSEQTDPHPALRATFPLNQGEGWKAELHAAHIPCCPLESGGSPVSEANGDGGKRANHPLPALRATFPLNQGEGQKN